MSNSPRILSVEKIWGPNLHCAFTDLIYFKNRWYCTFRESDLHVDGKDGEIRIIQSDNGKDWISVAHFSEKGADFRDPKLSVTPDGRLMLLIGSTEQVDRQPRVAFSDDGSVWSPFSKILTPGEWLWRVTWHKGIAYGVSYHSGVKLFQTDDGINYDLTADWDISDHPSEATVRFLEDDTMVVLLRRRYHAWIGTSKPPYTKWKWNDAKMHLGGPDFLVLPEGEMWASGRLLENTPYGQFERVMLAHMTLNELKPVLILPSGGDDTSYPGMVYQDNILWISYYSSHEETTAIYLAKIALN